MASEARGARLRRNDVPLRVALVLAAALLAGPGPARGDAPAPADCAESVARRVQARYDGVRDLRARFVQTTRSVAFGAESPDAEPARGEVAFAKPGRMRWSYEAPEPSLVVSDGETLWIYDPLAREVQVLDVDEGFLSGAALQFLLGNGRLLESFRVAAEGCGRAEVTLDLVPRAEATYERLRLDVDAASGEIRRTAVVDLFGNRTDVELSDVRTNQGLAPDLFRFEPPEGVRVLRLTEPSGTERR
jgi:outer membrane lipoprotein carrier protein